jgi:hypothetical protein
VEVWFGHRDISQGWNFEQLPIRVLTGNVEPSEVGVVGVWPSHADLLKCVAANQRACVTYIAPRISEVIESGFLGGTECRVIALEEPVPP